MLSFLYCLPIPSPIICIAAIAASGKLLSKWERRDVTDKVLFLAAIALFCLTAAYIVRKRLGAVWLLGWLF